MTAEPEAGTPAEHGDQQAEAVGIEPAGLASRCAVRGLAGQRLDFDQDGAAAFKRRRDNAAGRRAGVAVEERPRRVGDLDEAPVLHLEHTDLVGRAKPVLGRPQQPQRRVALALQVDHRVDQVLERLGPGDRPVLGHVTDEDHGDPVTLGEIHQSQCRLADLADAARSAIELVEGGGLDRVDDDQCRVLGPGHLHDPPDVVFREHPDALARFAGQQPEPSGAQPDLAGRLFAGRIEHAAGSVGRTGQAGGRLEQQRRLADPRLPADQDQRSGNQPAAEHPIELVDPERQAWQVRVGDLCQPGGLGHRVPLPGRRAPGPRRLAHDRLDQAVPLAAIAALPFPAKEGLRAALADEAALRPRHA